MSTEILNASLGALDLYRCCSIGRVKFLPSTSYGHNHMVSQLQHYDGGMCQSENPPFSRHVSRD